MEQEQDDTVDFGDDHVMSRPLSKAGSDQSTKQIKNIVEEITLAQTSAAVISKPHEPPYTSPRKGGANRHRLRGAERGSHGHNGILLGSD